MNMDAAIEVQQGKNQADAAVKAGVKLIIWSSLHNSDLYIQQRGYLQEWEVSHFTSKYRVEEYIRGLPNIESVFIYAGFYTTNFSKFPPFAPTRISGTSVEWALPLRADVCLPIYDVDDTGAYVKLILEQPKKYTGQRFLAAAEYLTLTQIAEIYHKVTGETASARVIPMPSAFPQAIVDSYRWFNEFGYYAGEALDKRVKLTGWEAWLKKTGWRV